MIYPPVTYIRRFVCHRMAAWLWISLALAAVIALLQPQLLPVTLYKLSLITSAAWLGYWIDRGLFPYARPEDLMDQPYSLGAPFVPKAVPLDAERAQAFAAAMLRRALIIAACIVGVALGA